MEPILLQCESFRELGGWLVETQSTRQLGSGYVMAHGYGVPVADAWTEADVPEAGHYEVWARTRNWNAVWPRGASPEGACVKLGEAAPQYGPQLEQGGPSGRPGPARQYGPQLGQSGPSGHPAAGRFQVLVNGAPLEAELGTGSPEWHWQKAGEIDLPAGKARLALHDLTGFNGRCAAIWLGGAAPQYGPQLEQGGPSGHPAPAAPAPQLGPQLEPGGPSGRPGPAVQDDATIHDLVVVGGGVAGVCAALSASRSGVEVLLLQDRAVLGGCNSSEVRVGMGGIIHTEPYPALGRVVEDIQPVFGYGRVLPAKFFEDDRKDNIFHAKELYYGYVPGVAPRVKYRQFVVAVEMDADDPRRIAAVLARDTRTGAVTRHRARLFCDATGDAVIARLAGCEVMYGREARSRYGEISAPVEADRQVMGMSVQWYAAERDAPAPFPDISDWAIPITDETGYYLTTGSWEQETGFMRDMADDTERIRDYSLLAIFSNWNWVKNHSPKKADYANYAFEWISPIGGKRESYRTVGDLVLNQNDLEGHVPYPDATASITWDTDFHFPDPENAHKFAEPFRSAAYHRGFGEPYPVPYRCLYARDCRNLFLAGRHISLTHVVFAAARVQRTLGMLGEVVGLAAAVCKEHDALPRDVYEKHLGELKAKMEAGVPPLPCFHPGGSRSLAERYDFNRRGWTSIYPPQPEIDPQTVADIKEIGFIHRNEHPQLRPKE